MAESVPFRLLKVMGLGALVLVAVVGSIWLSQADTLMTALPASDRPGQNGYDLPTPTLFPTLPPATPVPQAVNGTTVPVPTETLATSAESTPPQPSETPAAEVEACMLPAGWVVYTVRFGDTFYDLARQAQTNLQALLQGNCLAGVRALELGERIYLPAIVQATPTRAIPACGAPAGWPIVIVKPGETLYALSVRYGTTVVALRQANCLNSDLVKAGDPLFVPPHIVVPPTVPPTVVWWTPVPLPTAIPTDWPTPTPALPTETLPPTDTPTATIEPSPTPTPTETPILVPTWTPAVWVTP
ncbi:MAG: LysM peptidoglycan-binding domain-containing protein, partial [Anaerolineae bacterium]|nr:LysM peptidoglycan-binding domain-containing protein [Anaerolineae bacterium]